MTRDVWLRTHAWLAPLARFLDQVERALAGSEARAPLPKWDDYFADYCDGIPLLRSADAAIDREPAAAMVRGLIEKLGGDRPGDQLTAAANVLAAELASDPAGAPEAARRIVDWLLGEGDLKPSSPGLLRHLGWTALTRWLRPVVDAFARWRDEERWMRRYCPTCGSLPAMVWLVGVDPGHQRFQVCGCCGTRWRYRRTACPFCEGESDRLGVIAVESEPGFRIDHCESCRGYLKAYQGQGDDALFLADWTSLHLDVIAQDRGLKRLAGSLYDVDSMLTGPS